jgi:hypothetical protein
LDYSIRLKKKKKFLTLFCGCIKIVFIPGCFFVFFRNDFPKSCTPTHDFFGIFFFPPVLEPHPAVAVAAAAPLAALERVLAAVAVPVAAVAGWQRLARLAAGNQ